MDERSFLWWEAHNALNAFLAKHNIAITDATRGQFEVMPSVADFHAWLEELSATGATGRARDASRLNIIVCNSYAEAVTTALALATERIHHTAQVAAQQE